MHFNFEPPTPPTTQPETKSITSTPTFFSQRTFPKTQPSDYSSSTSHKRHSEYYTPQAKRVWKSRKTNETATLTTTHKHFTTFEDNTKLARRPNIAHDLASDSQKTCNEKHQHNTQRRTRSTSSFTRQTRRRIMTPVLPIGASPTMFAGHSPTHGRKLVVAPSVSHVSPDSTEPNLNSCTTLPHFPSPARDSQLATVPIPLRRFFLIHPTAPSFSATNRALRISFAYISTRAPPLLFTSHYWCLTTVSSVLCLCYLLLLLRLVYSSLRSLSGSPSPSWQYSH